jgi:hypothetical protein
MEHLFLGPRSTFFSGRSRSINGTFVPWPTLYVFQRQIRSINGTFVPWPTLYVFQRQITEFLLTLYSGKFNLSMTINVTAPSIGFQPLLRETVGVRPLQKKHWMPTFTNQSDHTTGMAPQASVSSIHEASIQIHLDSITIYHVLLLYYCACNLHASIGRV